MSKHFEQLGFTRGRGHPAFFHHRERGAIQLVHGDDYVSLGMPSELDWLQAELEKRYKIKTQMARGADGKEAEASILKIIPK